MTTRNDTSQEALPRKPEIGLLRVHIFGGAGTGKKTLAEALSRTRPTWEVTPVSGGEDDPDRLVAAALSADRVVLLTRPGPLPDGSGHGRLLAMLNLPRVVLAVTAMDMVDFDQGEFEARVAAFLDAHAQLSLTSIVAVPVSGIDGAENLVGPSDRTPWYSGPALLDAVDVSATDAGAGTDDAPAPERSATPEADQFETRILWLSDKPLVSGRQYRITLGSTEALSTPERPKYRLDTHTLQQLAARTLTRWDVGVVNIALDRTAGFRPYTEDARLGRFLLRDRDTDAIAGVGLVHFALRRSTNVRLQSLAVNPTARAGLKGHKPCVLWFTGLSGAGKSTVSNLVEHALNENGCHTILLDGDNVRHGLNRDLGFTEADRAENIRRIAEVARLMTDAGLIVLVSFISPFAAERRMARELVGGDQFVEIFVDAPLKVAESRDVKGLYRKARRGEIKNFTGIDSPYEAPESPDLHLRTGESSAPECAEEVLRLLGAREITP